MENCLGDDAMKIYQVLQFTPPNSEHTFQEILDALEESAVGIENQTYKCYCFDRESSNTS